MSHISKSNVAKALSDAAFSERKMVDEKEEGRVLEINIRVPLDASARNEMFCEGVESQ